MEYSEFRQTYELQHPASVPRLTEEIGIYPDWLEKVVGVMFVCASLLSGIHTVPAVRGGMTSGFWPQPIIDIVSMLSFVAIELVFFVAAYALMRKRQWHVLITLGAAFIVAMVANLKENIMAYQAGDPGTIIVAVTLGIGAPLIAFMAGKLFVDIHRARRSVGVEARRNYELACIQWDKEINKAWEKEQKSGNTTRRATSREIHEISQTSRENKPRVKLHEVAREIRENGHENMTTAEMMARYQISLGGTTKVRQLLQNGNGTH